MKKPLSWDSSYKRRIRELAKYQITISDDSDVKIRKLEYINEQLKKLIELYHSRIIEENKRHHTKKEISLKDWQLENLQTAITPLNLNMLIGLCKNDLIVIILNREAFLYSKIDEFQNSIKSNDREVFKGQLKEISRLTNLLIDKQPLFVENIKLKQKIKEMKK